MWKFKRASGWYDEYDSTVDKNRLCEKALNVADKKSGNNIIERVTYWLGINEIRESNQPSIQQTKRDLKRLFK